MSLPKITDADFDSITSKDVVLVKATAEWCGPCKAMAPTLDEVQKDMEGQIKMYDLDIDSNPISPTRFAVRGVPTMLVFKNGQHVGSKVGAVSKSQLVEFIESSIKD
jgi:thioredoxin 1